MNRLALSLSVMFAFCLGAFNGFSQEVAPLSTFSNQRASLPRYNFWINGCVGTSLSSIETKSAISSKDYWGELEMSASLSFDYCCMRSFIPSLFLDGITSVSVYLGGSVGYKMHRFSDYDALSGDVCMKPRYVGAEVFFSAVVGDPNSLFFEAGWRTDCLVGASFKSEGRGLIGMNPDCFTRFLNSLVVRAGFILGRIRLGEQIDVSVNPFISSTATEYYTGVTYTSEPWRMMTSFYISFLLGGTDR